MTTVATELRGHQAISEAVLQSVFADVRSVLCGRALLQALSADHVRPLLPQQERAAQKALLLVHVCSPRVTV